MSAVRLPVAALLGRGACKQGGKVVGWSKVPRKVARESRVGMRLHSIHCLQRCASSLFSARVRQAVVALAPAQPFALAWARQAPRLELLERAPALAEEPHHLQQSKAVEGLRAGSVGALLREELEKERAARTPEQAEASSAGRGWAHHARWWIRGPSEACGRRRSHLLWRWWPHRHRRAC